MSSCTCAMHEQSTNHISLIKQVQILCKVTHCTGHVSANTRPHQLRWGDWEIGTAIISCVECSQVADRIQKVGRDSSKSTVSSCSCPGFVMVGAAPQEKQSAIKATKMSILDLDPYVFVLRCGPADWFVSEQRPPSHKQDLSCMQSTNEHANL